MKGEKLEITYINPAELKAYGRNARTHEPEQVAQIVKSIERLGFANPVLVDEKNEIIAGHGRTLAALELGLESVPVVVLRGLTATEKKALRLADNQIALTSGWDVDLLASEIAAIHSEDEDFGLDTLGFSDEEIDGYLAHAESLISSESFAGGGEAGEHDGFQGGEVIDVEPPEPPKNPTTRPGDVWLLGEHRLLCGDSTKADGIAKLMAGEKVDLYLTDPPYNVAYVGGTDEKLTIQNDSMSDSDFRQFLVNAFTRANAVMKPGASFYIWHAGVDGYNFCGACRDIDWQVRQCLIWAKNSLVIGRQDYQWKHEPCLYGWKDGAGHKWYSDRKQTTVLEFNKPLRNGDHPTMKPVDLFAYLIGNSSRPGDIVLDNFAGSGTTVIACENLGRRARAMELDPKYCDVIIGRWQAMTGGEAVRADGVKFNDVTAAEEIV